MLPVNDFQSKHFNMFYQCFILRNAGYGHVRQMFVSCNCTGFHHLCHVSYSSKYTIARQSTSCYWLASWRLVFSRPWKRATQVTHAIQIECDRLSCDNSLDVHLLKMYISRLVYSNDIQSIYHSHLVCSHDNFIQIELFFFSSCTSAVFDINSVVTCSKASVITPT